MREQKVDLLDEKLSGKYIDAGTLSEKINRQIKSGAIQVSNVPLALSPMACLNWSLTYKIYDCLYDNEPLTPAEIVSLINLEKPEGIINHTLEHMSRIGITRPINHENLTLAEISSLIDYEKPEGIVNHTLEHMSRIGITRPINHENLTSADIPIKGLSILRILHQVKKWELTEAINM